MLKIVVQKQFGNGFQRGLHGKDVKARVNWGWVAPRAKRKIQRNVFELA